MHASAPPHLIVVGAGAAGLYTALRAAREGARVAIVSATPLHGASSWWAQGGLAAALAAEDSPERHLADTLLAGRGAVRRSAAEVLVAQAPAAVEDLARLGVRFDADRDGHLSLGLEGGHGIRRIVHAGGAATGRRIVRQLSALAAEDPAVEVHEDRRVVALLRHRGRVVGVRTLDGDTLLAPAVAICTGGAAALWSRTTNPAGATGSGLLLAHRAGAELADLELVQFHPTAVAVDGPADGFLVTEAVRGEGAHLLDADGERFVDELAPRDEVARAVQERMLQTGRPSVRLDMRHVDPGLFPNVVGALRRAGIDPEREPIPVAPAAHYVMGGIATDLEGRTSLPGLYAVGECACTGLHGANRLASNSLTECFVFGARAALAALQEPPLPPRARAMHAGAPAAVADEGGSGSPAEEDGSSSPAEEVGGPGAPPPLTAERRLSLWREAGLVRNPEGLRSLCSDPHPLLRLIGRSALAREESRGAHFRTDAPHRDPGLDGHHVVLGLDERPRLVSWR
jgi:L-aspartate oxidase